MKQQTTFSTPQPPYNDDPMDKSQDCNYILPGQKGQPDVGTAALPPAAALPDASPIFSKSEEDRA